MGGGVRTNAPRPRRIAIDFDGTIVKHAFPKIGEPLPRAFEVMKKLQDAGHTLILWTCREDSDYNGGSYNINKQYLKEAIEFCRENGIEFVSANCNRPEDEFRPNGGRKVYADIYIDDRNLGGFPGWDEVERLILGEYSCPAREIVMEIDDVFQVRGTVLVGRLWCDVKVGDEIEVKTRNGFHPTRIISIEVFAKSLEKGFAGQTCGLLLRNFQEVDAWRGDTVYRRKEDAAT